MSGFVQAVGTGGCVPVSQHEPQWSWSVFVEVWPTYCSGYSLIHWITNASLMYAMEMMNKISLQWRIALELSKLLRLFIYSEVTKA